MVYKIMSFNKFNKLLKQEIKENPDYCTHYQRYKVLKLYKKDWKEYIKKNKLWKRKKKGSKKNVQ